MTMTEPNETALQALREPFPAESIGLLPKATKRNVSDSEKKKCPDCDAYIGPHIHLSYVGHSTVTDRLLTTDLLWNWEPCSMSEEGLPQYRESPNGLEIELWIRLTVGGVTRLGVGIVSKDQDDLGKKLISDALKNTAMRFGVALELWSKDELESQIGTDRATTRRRAPRSSTPTTGRVTRPRSATDPATEGQEGMSVKDRNKLIAHLARLDPPVRGDTSVNAHISALLDSPEPIEGVVKLTAVQGAKLFDVLGIK